MGIQIVMFRLSASTTTIVRLLLQLPRFLSWRKYA